MINQTLASFSAHHPRLRVTAIHSGRHPQGVIGAIIAHMMAAAGRRHMGEVLLITHAALLGIPDQIKKTFGRDWHLIVDEVPAVTACHTQSNLPRGVRTTLSAASQGVAYGKIEVTPGCRGLWNRIARGKSRSPLFSTPEYRALAADIMHPHKSVYVLLSQWYASANPNSQVSFFTVLEPSVLDGFAGEPTLLSACIEDTLLYRLWTLAGVKWQRHDAMASRLRATEHTNGNLLAIHYAIEADWSKRLRDRPAWKNASTTLLEEMRDGASRLLGSAPHVYLVNRDAEDVVGGCGTQLPNTPHGLNAYQDIDNAVIYSALNLTPAHIKFLDARGISADEIRQAITYQASYQAALRTSLRDVNSRTQKSVVVPDKGCAEYFARLFPGCGVKRLPTQITTGCGIKTNKRRDTTNPNRFAEYREEKKLERAIGLDLLYEGAEKCAHRLKDESACAEYSASLIGMSLFGRKTSPDPFDVIPWEGADRFISDLRGFADISYADKSENKLISPSIFDPALAEQANEAGPDGKPRRRGRINVVSSIGIWLDNDGGDMPVDEFTDLFPHLRMAIYNTYSSTVEEPRWRVFIPTSHAMTAEVYLHITAQLKQVIEQAGSGYRSKSWLLKWIDRWCKSHPNQEPDEVPYQLHGFDWSKCMPENLIYLPCRAQDSRPKASFFLDVNDGYRQPLDVLDAVQHSILNERPEPDPIPVEMPIPPRPEVPEGASPAMTRMIAALQAKHDAEFSSRREHLISAAIHDWRLAYRGTGNESFLALGIRLKRAGLDLGEVRQILKGEAVNGRSPSERKAQVKNVIDWIRKKGI